MQWLNPLGAWAFLGLAAILALYMLRREYQETQISSTYLWRRALRDQTASRPFQKLRSSILMMLQLLLAAMLALSLMRPVAPGQALGGETVMIFDVSASMQAVSGGQSRMDQAVSEAAGMINTMGGADRLTILTAGKQTNQLLSRSPDRREALRTLSRIEAENGGADLSGALSLAQAMRREIGQLDIIVYSDNFTPPEGMELTHMAVGKAADNRAITALNASAREGAVQALIQVVNYGAAADVPVECYADGELYDVRVLSMAEGETQSVRFDLPEGTQYVRAALSEKDALSADDQRHFIVMGSEPRRVALMGADDIFLETALAQRTDVEVVRTTVADAALLPPCDLYVYDGVMPDTLPNQGAFLFLAPKGVALGVTPGPVTSPQSSLRLSSGGTAEAFSGHVALSRVALKEFTPLIGGQPILTVGQDAAAVAGEENGSRFVVMGFDLHESNWVVQYDFPIFMMHVFEYLLPDALGGAKDALSGDSIAISLQSRAASAQVLTPSGQAVPLAPPFPALPLTDTQETGVYTLRQTLPEGETIDTRFAVNLPGGESDVRLVSEDSGANQRQAGTQSYGLEWTAFLVLALLLVSMLEWWVSVRAN
jgi:hypothetical protein